MAYIPLTSLDLWSRLDNTSRNTGDSISDINTDKRHNKMIMSDLNTNNINVFNAQLEDSYWHSADDYIVDLGFECEVDDFGYEHQQDVLNMQMKQYDKNYYNKEKLMGLVENQCIHLGNGLRWDKGRKCWLHDTIDISKLNLVSSRPNVYKYYNKAPKYDWVIFNNYTGQDVIDEKLYFWYDIWHNYKLNTNHCIAAFKEFAGETDATSSGCCGKSDDYLDIRYDISHVDYVTHKKTVDDYICFGMLLTDFIKFCNDFGTNFMMSFIETNITDMINFDEEYINAEVDKILKR